VLLLGVGVLTGVGCAPSWSLESRRPVESQLASSILGEYASPQGSTGEKTLVAEGSSLGFDESRLEQLGQMAGPDSYESDIQEIHGSLLGDWDDAPVDLSLQEAIASAIEHNLTLLDATLVPAIREEQRLAADAVFDLVFFADGSVTNNDNPSAVPVVFGTPTGVGVNKNDVMSSDTGIRAQTRSGGQVELRGSLDSFNNASPGFTLSPDPSQTANLDLLLTQNLLQGAGRDATESQLRLATNNTARGQEQLRQALLATIETVEREYWTLVEAKQSVQIRERLLTRGEQTRDALRGRMGFDVTDAELADAVAKVELRKADLIRARNTLQQRSDALKASLNDPRFPLSLEVLLEPTERPGTTAITFSLVDTLQQALVLRPEIRLANLDIDDAEIRRRALEDARLPLLAMDARVNLTGLDGSADQSFNQAFNADFVDSSIGLRFEQPIGNRAGDAGSRRGRLERMQSVVRYRLAVQNVVLEVKNTLRDVVTNFRLMEQTRISRLAATENLRSLEVEEATIRSLTPEFLNLKLTRQRALALAEIAEIQALVSYSTSLAALRRATGSSLESLELDSLAPIGPDASRDLFEDPRFADTP
jgi:outer membrane protein